MIPEAMGCIRYSPTTAPPRQVFLYFVALLLTALLERDPQRTMAREIVKELPLYPEECKNKQPTADQVLLLFSSLERHRLYQAGKEVHVFRPKLTEFQTRVLTSSGSLRPSIGDHHTDADNSERNARFDLRNVGLGRSR